MTRWMTLSAAALFVAAVSTQAQDAPKAPESTKPVKLEKKAVQHPPMAAEAISVSGKLSKEQKTIKSKKEGVPDKTVSSYAVTTADGVKVMLPNSKNVTAEVMDGMLDKDVTVTGTGRTMERDGKKVIYLMTLKSVTCVVLPLGGGEALPVVPKAQ